MDVFNSFIVIAGFFLGLVYSVGLIIVTIHLSRYGITNIYLVRTKYLVVGFTYFLHVLGMGLLSAPVAFLLVILLGLDVSVYIALPLSILGVYLILSFGIHANFTENKIFPIIAREFPESPINVWYFWYSMIFCSFLFPWYSLIKSYFLNDSFSLSMAVLLLVGVFFSGIAFYVLFLYPNPISVDNPVLELIGSGKPIQVRLTIDKNAISSLEKYNLITSGDEVSETILLLDETDQYFLVLTDFDEKNRALRISKEIIHSIIYLP